LIILQWFLKPRPRGKRHQKQRQRPAKIKWRRQPGKKSLAVGSFEGLRAGEKQFIIPVQANNKVNQSIYQT